MSASTADARSPKAIARIASAGTAEPIWPGAKALDGKYRSAWTRNSGTSASRSGSRRRAGLTYQRAIAPKTIRENVNCTPNSVVGLISGIASGAKPAERLLSIDEPFRRKHGGAFNRLGTRIGETRRHEEGESTDAGSAVARDDVRVAPLHHTWTEPVVELRRVDEETFRPRPLRF